ncbi:MAG: hypothetical protein HY720_32460 [Planctomycetes bacterium]|nr:hypothetical protein [Planctomycetota bacterium]
MSDIHHRALDLEGRGGARDAIDLVLREQPLPEDRLDHGDTLACPLGRAKTPAAL